MSTNAEEAGVKTSELEQLFSTTLSEDFKNPDFPVVLFVRHAERPELPEQETGNELKLTRAGLAAARTFGFALAQNVKSINTSPIIRCKETASLIGEAASCAKPIAESEVLGDPGAYVHDEELAWSNWLQHGSESVLNNLMAEDTIAPGLHSAEHGTEVLLKYFQQFLSSENGYHICVSHDVVILPFISYLLKIPINEIPWPGFLQTALLHVENDQLILKYQAFSKSIDLDELSV